LGNRPNLGPGVNAPEVMRGTNQGGAQFVGAQGTAQVPLFNQLANQQFDQVGRFAKQLDNAYTRDARNQVNQSFGAANQLGTIGNSTMAMGDAAGQQITNLAPLAQQQAGFAADNIYGLAPQVTQIGDQYMGQIGGLGSMLADQSRNAFAQAGPTGIEQALYDQGQAELAMGRALSPEELRDATQSSRQGMAARGMATGNAALGAELLNRDRFANQRLNQRRAFAADANNLREQNVNTRRELAGNMATASGNLYDTAGRIGMSGREIAGRLFDAGGRMNVLGTQTAGDLRAAGADTAMSGRQIGGALLNNSALLRQAGAGMLADLDPYQRAIQGGLSLGQTAQAGALDTVQGGFNNALDLFANTGSFNVNRGDSLYNSWLNNATAIQTGQTAANSQTNAANISAAATRAARPKWYETALGAVGNIFSDERMKTDVKPIGTAGNVLGLTAYEFRYKGDKKKHKGFMAQDVQKVLPEAVEEMDYKGKRRLTIKPMVIGAALAEELLSAKAA
jgi:hypothetical protein